MNERKESLLCDDAFDDCALQVRLLQTAIEEATEKKISMTSAVYDVVRFWEKE